MTAPDTAPFGEIGMISTEHGISLFTHEPFVKITVDSNRGPLIAQLSPEDARILSTSIVESADRANYEGDFVRTARRAGIEDEMLAVILQMIREGEIERHGGEGQIVLNDDGSGS